MHKLKILLADDHQLIREGIKNILKQNKNYLVCAEASNGKEAVSLAEKVLPDIAILDISMKELNGLEAAARFKKFFPEVKVIILSIHKNEEYIMRAFESGAKAYILKESAPDELLEALKKVMKNELYISSIISGSSFSDYIKRIRSFSNKSSTKLTSRQTEILQLIAEGNSTKEIARKLFISPKTVESHRTAVMNKLEVNNVIELVRYSISRGIVNID